ncbi:MAG: hypothetical protein K6F94_03935 [Bacteroidaceae bacterium]|nr:hypothetical protein [Bacteroidaceae bacterium]
MITIPNFAKMDGLAEWLKAVPFDVNRSDLYSAAEIYKGYEPSEDKELDSKSFAGCYDSLVYQHYISQGKFATNMNESLARALHDHSIHFALKQFTHEHNVKRCVGVMGGHNILRSNPMFSKVVMMSKRLTEEGFYIVSGGGPGAMEAAHLGAWMAGRSQNETEKAIKMLADAAVSFKDDRWLSSAMSVMRLYPQHKFESLGIPTWLYGHEPSTPFATHIAKFFTNSIREDVILTIAFGGIIYTPGSAGTLQEIFQDAVQNHYVSLGISSPMIFLGKQFWTEEVPVYSLLKHLTESGIYKNLQLMLSDDSEEIEAVLKSFQKSFAK